MSQGPDITAHVTPEGVVLQMIVDDIRTIKDAQTACALENREEFRRLKDKMDNLRDEMYVNLTGHDRDIVRLTTQASIAGRVSGFFAGSAAGVITAVLVDIIRHMFFVSS